MQCEALTIPERLASLLKELDEMQVRDYQSAYVCVGPSIEEPGRNRLFIVPKNRQAGANPSLWLRQNNFIIQKEFSHNVTHCSVVFPGDLPQNVEHQYVSIKLSNAESRKAPAQRRRDFIRREVRLLSATTHIWVDRLRLHNTKGDIDTGQRENLIIRLSTQRWNEEKERVYVPPTLQGVRGGSGESIKARELLLDNRRPVCREQGLVVLYGPGGIGKTFFLDRLVYKLGTHANSDVLASIPVFVQAPTLLHKQALENWLALHGFDKLTLQQITVLLRYGFIIPLLDALDEVVKGEARQGSEEFLKHLVEFTSSREAFGRGVLACRDYYLNSDGFVPDIVRQAKECPVAELSFGFFNHRERQRFIQLRAGLDPSHASRWATALETQASEILGKESRREVQELIGHPVVLDTLARYIKDLPPEQRITMADEFKITSSDIFGQIIEQLLGRERNKMIPIWERSFKGRLKSSWLDPMEPQKQKQVLHGLTLLAAKDGAVETERRALDNDVYRPLKHGVFMFTEGVRPASNRTEALQQLLRDIIGSPEVLETILDTGRDAIINEALKHLAEAYAGHILANTEPGLPDDLVFAFRHRTYFDYFLADNVIEQLLHALRTKRVESFVQWCERHHIFDTFGTCLDFLQWDPRVTSGGMGTLHEFIEAAEESDDLLAGYIISLALALFIRRGQHLEGIPVEGLSFAPYPKWELLLIREMLTPTITGLKVYECSFPNLTVSGINFRELSIHSCDFETLRLISSTYSRCEFLGLECKKLCLGGVICFQDSTLDLSEGSVVVENGANADFFNCRVSHNVLHELEKSRALGSKITLSNVTCIEPVKTPPIHLSSGRRFINRVMALARRGGRKQYSIYQYKLRDYTPGSDDQFKGVIRCLQEHECMITEKNWVVLTPEAADHMYKPRPGDEPSYESQCVFWDPIVEEIDEILEKEK